MTQEKKCCGNCRYTQSRGNFNGFDDYCQNERCECHQEPQPTPKESLQVQGWQEFDAYIQIILTLPFLNPPLDNIKIGELRISLEWQKEQIKKLFSQVEQQAIERERENKKDVSFQLEMVYDNGIYSERQRIVEVVEGMNKVIKISEDDKRNYRDLGYNQALEDVINKIKK